MTGTGPIAAPEGAGSELPRAGWYADPMRAGSGWRWWNGGAWTTFTEQSAQSGHPAAPVRRRPRLPRWLSVPVICAAPIVLIGIVVMAIMEPVAALAGLVPLAIVLPVITWLDRVEPEPRASRVHAILWGATVAVVVGALVNALVSVVGGETLAIVVGAPVIEEAAKALGVVWAVRRSEIDGIADGVVYAAWVALGFAVVEDMLYFTTASIEGSLLPVFILRALLTPFAHPLFTYWTGLAIGRAVAKGRPIWPSALWGYGLAVLAHGAWNGSLVLADVTADVDETIAGLVVLGFAGLFVALFVIVGVFVVRIRRRQQEQFIAAVPGLVLRYNIGPDEAQVFTSWRGMLRARRRLPRKRRRQFDTVHATLARLVALDARAGIPDPEAERVLAAQLGAARGAWRSGGRPG